MHCVGGLPACLPVLELWGGIDWWEAAQWVPETGPQQRSVRRPPVVVRVLFFHSPLTYGSSLTLAPGPR